MPIESDQKRLTRVRRPRVHITYDVQVGDAIEKRELPFVVGVMADLSGDRDRNKPMPKPKDRKFVKVDRDNLDEVMGKIKPRLEASVKNTLENDGTNLGAVLTFDRLADFNPENVVKQIPPLNDLLVLRTKLANLRSSLYGNERLETLLESVIQETEKRQAGVSETQSVKEKT